ncbi:MAG: hypothetical protein DHS20C14_10560 [Phycisphaeraceae bacterium]|nr:MAG: hypothetical protein DHS20C14_10560 [Phycisphaeraceae bacterium]
MPVKAAPGEQYTVRRKILKIFGAAFHIYDAQGSLAGYAKQKAFKLREDIRIYTDESCSSELIVLRTQQVIDFGATYDITLPTGEKIGSLRRKGLKSSLLRDEWLVFDDEGAQVGMLRELGSVQPIIRRYVNDIAVFFPQRFEIVRSSDGAHIATLRQHFNPFIYRLGLAVHQDDQQFDELILLGATCLIAAIEGRQG